MAEQIIDDTMCNAMREADELVRDLEAAPDRPAPRTITREEWNKVFDLLGSTRQVERIAAAWRLTVEDA
jgi:hypothetical protein